MLHATMEGVDNLAHIDSYVAYKTMAHGAYTASDSHPVPEETRSRFFLHIYCRLDLEFLHTPTHIHMHVVIMYEYKTIITVLIASVQQITVVLVLPM